LLEAASHWRIEASTLGLVGDFENFVYEARLPDRPCILRIGHCSHRSASDLHGELDFIRFLAGRGLGVCAPIASINGRDVEAIGAEFFACAFERAPGKAISERDPAIWNERTLSNWGKILADFHLATRDYTPAPSRPRRFRWDQDDCTSGHHLPPEDADISARLASMVERVNAMPASLESYGLIHADLHYGNFFGSETGEIAAFDFDDATYHWFSYDLAVAFNALPSALSDSERDHAVRTILTGYRQRRPLPPSFHDELRQLLLLRDMQLYQLIHKKTAPTDRSASWLSHAARLAQRIRNAEPACVVSES
jgi:Ser/Thr protein kinase RdoA (MazF antagonist)